MKNIILSITIILLFSIKVMSQCTSGASWCTVAIPIGTADVLGGDGNTLNPLRITTVGVNRMFIDGSGVGSSSGNVGIGNAFTTPASRLHVRQGSNETAWFQITGNNTGSLATDGLRIGVLNPVGVGGRYDVEIRQQENAPMNFFTTDSISIKERFRIPPSGASLKDEAAYCDLCRQIIS